MGCQHLTFMTWMNTHGTLQILSNICHVHPPYNLVKSAHIQMVPTLRLRLYTRLSRSMRNWVSPRHMIMRTQQRRLSSRQPSSIAVFSVHRMASQSLQQWLSLSKWHGRKQIQNLEPHWHWHRWNDVLRFELKKLSGLEIYKISITHNLKDNNFNTYLYLQGGSS